MVHAFGPFRYDAEQRLLFREGELVPMVPKALETLHVLLERRGAVVEKAELMRLVWPDTTVEEVGLARNISVLRKALGDEGEGPGYIETIPKRGYRFAAAAAEKKRPRRRWWWWAGLGALLAGGVVYLQFYVPSRFVEPGGHASLAVVPFGCLCPGMAGEEFSEGLNEVLVAELARIEGVQVVGPSTVRRHRRFGISMGLMGRLLGLDVLVEGLVQKLDGRLRITARLVDVHTGKVIWAESFDGAAEDLSRTQAEVGRAVAGAVGLRLKR